MTRLISTLLIVLVAFPVPPAFSSPQAPPPPLISAELLEKAHLQMIWQNKLPLQAAELIDRLFLRGDNIYALSSHNYLFCLNTKNAAISFAKPLVAKNLSVFNPQLFENQLLFVAGNSLLKMDPHSGSTDTLKRPQFTITCPAVRNLDNIYLAGADSRLHILNAETRLSEFEASADNESIITSIAATDQFVTFSTEAGNVISITPDKPVRNWQFDAAGPISAPLLLDLDNRSLFVSSQDTNLYKIDTANGDVVWKFRTGAALVESSRLTNKLVYQPARKKGLYAIDKMTGRQLWQLPDGLELLAESGNRAYVMTAKGRLVVMDTNSAKKLYSVNFAAVAKYVPNTTHTGMHIADDTGRIACLKPADQ